MPGPAQTARRFEWERTVRRVCMSSSTKFVALTLASYASPAGERVWPGLDRLIAVTGLSRSTVQRSLRELRRLGLIDVTRKGNRRQGKADEYRLTIPGDLGEQVAMLDVHERPDQASPMTPKEPVDNSESGVTHDANDGPDQASTEPRSGVTHDAPTEQLPTPKNNKASDDHRADVEGTTALALENAPNPSTPKPADYPAATARLQRLPDLGATLIARAAQQLPAGATLREQVIAAAALAGEPP